jgi:glycosyltransferase involved in cell wall biosynthesis
MHQLGGPDPCFESLDAASLALGYRYIRNGAFVRHFPVMLPDKVVTKTVDIPLRDELRFLRAGFTRRWLYWAGFRSVLRDKRSPVALLKAWREIKSETPSPVKTHYQRTGNDVRERTPEGKVSVLIPTLRRYPYLCVLLNQLREQTVTPFEILVIDQTPQHERNPDLKREFSDLPLSWYFLDQAGQCSSRNFGLDMAQSEFILLLDDDIELQPDLIEKHLYNLARFQTNVSNGVLKEKDLGELPEDFRFLRVSNVFPACNTLLRKRELRKSGLFDLAYDHGQRADHDLGMRLYLSGELMVLDPAISILHHRAPMGGLREHKARIHTYAASRNNIFKQNLPTVSDLYLAKRYFSDQQVKEMCWTSVLGTFSLKGPFLKRFAKIIVGFLSLPNSFILIIKRLKVACAMLEYYPQIPELSTDEKP